MSVEVRVLSGARLRMSFADGSRVWWFEDPYEAFEDHEIRPFLTNSNGAPRFTEAGDCLFGWEGNSQTWISVFEE